MQRFVNLHRLPANFHDRRRRARVRSGSHGGDVGRKQNEKSGRSRARTGRRDVRSHRNWTTQNRLNDFPHGGVETARRVHRDQNQRGVIAIRVCSIPLTMYSARTGSISPSIRSSTTLEELVGVGVDPAGWISVSDSAASEKKITA